MTTKRVNTFVIVVLTVMVLLVMGAEAADGDFEWAGAMGGINDDFGRSITVDSMGNIYTTGHFEDTMDFDPGAGTFNLTSAGDGDIYVSKFDNAGNFVWAKSIGGVLDESGLAIAMDNTGNICITGYFESTADFDPGPGIFNLVPTGGRDIFVSKLDSAGNFVWVKGMGGMSLDQGQAIVVDSIGSVYITGIFEDTADFDPGAGTFNLTSVGSWDIFVSKLDSTGSLVWAKAVGGAFGDYGFGIAVDNESNVYTTGYFPFTVDFDPGPGIFNLVSSGTTSTYVLKLDSTGTFIWAKVMDGTAVNIGSDIEVDEAANVYTTGHFDGAVDFDPGPNAFNLTAVGLVDLFLSKLDNAGNFVWAKTVGGIDDTRGYSIVLDDAGNIYTAGRFSVTSDFDPGAGTFNLTSAGDIDIFVSKLDSGGNFVWAKAMGGTGRDESNGIAVDGTGNVYTTGWFESTADFDPGAGTFNITSAGGLDAFVLKLSAPPDTTPPDISISTPSVAYTSPGGSVDYTVSYTGESVVFLSPADITLNTTGDVTATVSIWPTKNSDYTVTLSNITGAGMLGFTIAAGSAMDEAGNLAAEASTPILVTVESPMPVVAWPAMLALFIVGAAAMWQRMGILRPRRQQGR